MNLSSQSKGDIIQSVAELTNKSHHRRQITNA